MNIDTDRFDWENPDYEYNLDLMIGDFLRFLAIPPGVASTISEVALALNSEWDGDTESIEQDVLELVEIYLKGVKHGKRQMQKITTEQFALQAHERIDSKLSPGDRALLLGLGINDLSPTEIATRASVIAQALTNEEVILLTRIMLREQCSQSNTEKVRDLIHELLHEDLSEERQYENRINLIYRVAVFQSAKS